MIPIKFDIVEKAIAVFSTEIEKQRSDAYDKLNALKQKLTVRLEIDYLDKIIPLFDKSKDVKDTIVCAKPDVLKDLSAKGTNEIKLPANCSKEFSKKILECLQYEILRTKFYPKFFSEIGIKACVYCNSQLAIVAKVSRNKFSARFELDHYINKDDYPFLSISLYNLYPVCSYCNKRKWKSDISSFQLYKEKSNHSQYKFELEAGCVASYIINNDIDKIKIIFNEPAKTSNTEKTLNEICEIQEIYDTQKDLVEEMIVKNQIYNDAYIATLKTSFQSLFQNPDLFDRVIYGNYMKVEEIHKRPMSKFTQDITEELKKISRK